MIQSIYFVIGRNIIDACFQTIAQTSERYTKQGKGVFRGI